MTTHRPGRMGAPQVSATAVVEMEEGQAHALGIQRGSVLTITQMPTGSGWPPDGASNAQEPIARPCREGGMRA